MKPDKAARSKTPLLIKSMYAELSGNYRKMPEAALVILEKFDQYATPLAAMQALRVALAQDERMDIVELTEPHGWGVDVAVRMRLDESNMFATIGWREMPFNLERHYDKGIFFFRQFAAYEGKNGEGENKEYLLFKMGNDQYMLPTLEYGRNAGRWDAQEPLKLFYGLLVHLNSGMKNLAAVRLQLAGAALANLLVSRL